jgi:hypothetical protein
VRPELARAELRRPRMNKARIEDQTACGSEGTETRDDVDRDMQETSWEHDQVPTLPPPLARCPLKALR